MKKIFFTITSVGVLLLAQMNQNDEKLIIKIASEAYKEYTQILKKTLKTKLQNEGEAKAIEYCYNNANSLTMKTGAKLSRELKVRIKLKRISYKNRNPYNRPNINEYKILRKMQQQKRNKNNLVIVEYPRKIQIFQAIYVKKVCLRCHGSMLDINVKNTLKKYYSYDKAINYKQDDFRGAVVVTIDKNSFKKHFNELNKTK
ncbi:Tll0287-like domain-containing protein [Nautilia lithotrophica]